MRYISKLMLTITLAILGGAIYPIQAQTNAPEAALVFREPFTLKIQVDKEHYYEETFDRKIPFVADNDVYLFSGDSFGLNLGVTKGKIDTVTYQKEKAGADIELEFKQNIQKNGSVMMLLVIKNNIKQILYLDALMTVPGKEGIYKTSILPIQPGLSGYESWPHPIVQLVLRNLRFNNETPNNDVQ